MPDIEVDMIPFPTFDPDDCTKLDIIEGWSERLNDLHDAQRQRFQCFVVTQDMVSGTCRVHARFLGDSHE